LSRYTAWSEVRLTAQLANGTMTSQFQRAGLDVFVWPTLLFLFVGCTAAPRRAQSNRAGDEIVVAGQLFHTGARVVTWMDKGGYDGYRGAKPLIPRHATLSPEENARVKTAGWDLATLQKAVDQFVLHYDGHGLSKTCFEVLQQRGLSVHFMLDLDGTIYQTLDLKERALHATTSNDRSIGIEIANLGAFPPGETKELDEWYQRDAQGNLFISVPKTIGDPKLRLKYNVPRPARGDLVRGFVHGIDLVQYDFTAEQYAALIKLTATLCRIFPGIRCAYPRDAAGRLITHKLPDEELAKYRGVLGHFHIQTNKTDPGPALQWDKLIDDAREAAK
jgi:N-acetyl-anhydromuramyl-L-alanine amidase AmpD